jgi:hypothetical protein
MTPTTATTTKGDNVGGDSDGGKDSNEGGDDNDDGGADD